MLTIAVVEDMAEDFRHIEALLKKYAAEKALRVEIKHYDSAIKLLENYKPLYDVIFMDINLPLYDGMTAAKKLRQFDEIVPLVFLTDFSQYAIEGYAVGACSYILKPATYPQLKTIMNGICRRDAMARSKTICINTKSASYCFRVNEIVYVLVQPGHYVEYFLENEKNISVSGTLTKVLEMLPADQFVQCNSGCLVNLRFVRNLSDGMVDVGFARFVVSRAKKKAFISALNHWVE